MVKREASISRSKLLEINAYGRIAVEVVGFPNVGPCWTRCTIYDELRKGV